MLFYTKGKPERFGILILPPNINNTWTWNKVESKIVILLLTQLNMLKDS